MAASSHKEVTCVKSHIPCEKDTARWEIQGFSRLQLDDVNNVPTSKTLMTLMDVDFTLKISAGEQGNQSERPITLKVGLHNLGDEEISFKITTLGLRHEGVLKHNYKTHKVGSCEANSWLTWSFKVFCTYRQLCQCVQDDILCLELQGEVWRTHAMEDVSLSKSMAVAALGNEQSALSRAFGGLLCEGTGADVQLCLVGEEPLKAHRLVLAARSAVFKSMFFSSGMAESASNSKVQMLDVEPQAVRPFLQYLYTDKLPAEIQQDDEMSCHLLAIAYKYEVEPLVEICAASIAAKLSEENSCERLMMADMLGVDSLKQLVLCFVTDSRDKLAKVQSTEGYTRFVQQRPHLLADVLSRSTIPVTKKRPLEPPALPADLNSRTVSDLKRLLADRGLPTSGSKTALVNRLRSHTT